MNNKIGDKATEVKDTTVNAATQVKDALFAAANYIKDAVTHKASEAKEVVEDKATEVKDVTEDKVSEVRKAVSEAKEAIDDKAAEMKKAIDDKFSEVKRAVEDKASEVKKTVSEATDEAADKAAELKDAAEDKTVEAKEAASEAKDTVVDKVVKFKDAVVDKVAEVKNAVFEAKDEAADKAAELKDEAEDKAAEVKDAAEDKAKEVKKAVDRALKIMSKKQLSTGGYNSWGTENCESTAQAIVALTALGIDIDTDSRFIKTDKKGNKNTLMDGMMQFYCKGGGFAHVNEGYDGGGGSGTGLNAMATDQGMYALDAYYRYINGKKKLYDMTDASQTLAIGNNPDLEKKPNNNNNGNNGNNNQNTNQGNRNNGNTNSNINRNTGNKNVKTDNQGNKKYTSNVGGKKVTTTENKSATISIKTIYSGEKDGLIPENKKCVIIQFEKKEKEQIVGFKVSEKKQQYLYYSKELSKKSGCATYIALFDTSVEKEALLNMDNYAFHKIQKEDNNTDQVITDVTDSKNKDQQQEDYTHPEKYEITFGDVNNDKVVNAQDILDVQSILSGKLDLTDERQIIAINVSMDSKIDNGDINQIMDNFVSKKDYTIFEVFSDKKDDKDSNNKSSDKENTSNKTSNDSQKEDIKQND